MYHSIDPHMDEETIELLNEIYGTRDGTEP